MHLFSKSTGKEERTRSDPMLRYQPGHDDADELIALPDPGSGISVGAERCVSEEASIARPSGPTETVSAEALIDRLTDRRYAARRGPVHWFWTLAAAPCALAIVSMSMSGEPVWALLFLVCLATMRTLNIGADRLRATRAAFGCARLGTSWLGAACEALEWPDAHVRRSAALLLTDLLPGITKEGAPALSESQLACLTARLSRRAALADPELAIAILRALPLIGTEGMVPAVHRLADSPALFPRLPRIRATAIAAVALLERRVVQMRGEAAAQSGAPPTVGATDVPLSDAETQELARAAQRVDTEMRRYEEDLKRLQKPGMRHGFLLATWLIIVPYFVYQSVMACSNGQWPLGLLLAGLAAASTQAYRLTMTEQHKSLAARLARLDDVQCIGRLADALEWPDAEVTHVALLALTRLLKRVRASDRIHLTPRQRANLHRTLNMAVASRHPEYLFSLLSALEQIGDESAVPFIEPLTRAQPVIGMRIPYPGMAARQNRVREAAQFCLEALKWRVEATRTSQTLLRASGPGSIPVDALLRAAPASSVTNPEQLLRVAANEPAGGAASGAE